MSDVDSFTDDELRIARQGAMSAARSGRGLIPLEDLVAEANLWMVEHMEKLRLWRDKGSHGKNSLRRAVRQRCLTLIAAERRRRSGHQSGDVFWYTPQIIRELMPDIWDEDDWLTGSAPNSGELRGPSRPSEGNNRLAMICDVRSAFYGLSDDDQTLLANVYRDSLPWAVIAVNLDVHERTVRRREERVLEKMVERLGGEPPWR